MKFLATNNFDFNKLFKHGISYTRLSERDELIEYLKNDQRPIAESGHLRPNNSMEILS